MKQIKFVAILMAMFLGCLSLASCSDDDDNGQPEKPKQEMRLLSYTEGSTGIQYQYSPDGKISKELRDGYTTTYSYSSEKIVVTTIGDYDERTTYILSNGLITKMLKNEGQNITEYTYKDGYLVSEKSSDDTWNFVWEGGNMVKQFTTGEDATTLMFTYTDKPAYSPFWLANGNDIYMFDYTDGLDAAYVLMSQGYFGKMPKNLPYQEKEVGYGLVGEYRWGATNSNGYIESYEYWWPDDDSSSQLEKAFSVSLVWEKK